MRQNPGQFAPRTAPEPGLHETLVGTALALGLFAVLFLALLFPVVGVAVLTVFLGAVLVRVGGTRFRGARVALRRRGRRARLAVERSRTGP
jgi:hypothetical protein